MKKRTFLIIIIIMIIFIWGHSMVPLASSAEESAGVMKILQGILDLLHIPITLTEHFVRKLAHFTEHAAAGLLFGLYFYLRGYKPDRPHIKPLDAVIPLILGFFVGFMDETIQIFSGRGASVTDVWIDFGGVCCGALVSFIIVSVKKRKKKEQI